jgi:CHAT domain-containing protein/tetratricopeptide (TPR) repeat protein
VSAGADVRLGALPRSAGALAAVPLLFLATAAPGAGLRDDVEAVRALVNGGRYEDARVAAAAAVARAARAGDRATEAEALLVLSDALWYLNRQRETPPLMRRALRLARQAGDARAIGRALYNLSFEHERTEPERMVRLLEEAEPWAARSGDLELQMFVQNAFGTACWSLSRFGAAFGHFGRAAALAERRGDRRALSIAWSNLGLTEQHRGRYDEALRYLQDALALQEQLGGLPQTGNALASIAGVYLYLGERDRAVSFLERALEKHRQLGSKFGQSGQLEALAQVREEAGEAARAEELRREALRLALEIGDDRRAVTLLCALARQRSATGRLDQAQGDLDDAAARAARSGDAGQTLAVAHARAQVERQAGRAAAALHTLAGVEPAAARLGDVPLGELLARRAELLEALRRPGEAIDAYTRAIALHERTRARRYLHLWHGRLARLHAALGHDREAGAHFERSAACVEELDRLLVMDRFRLELFHEVADVFRGYALWLARRGEARRAFEVLEDGRARTLRLKLVQGGGGGAALTPAEREALATVGSLQKRLREQALPPPERAALLRQVAAAEDDYERARAAGPRGEGARRGPLVFPPDAVVVAYALAPEGLLVLGHRQGRLTSRIVQDVAAVEAYVAALRARAADPAAPQWREPAAELYRLLLAQELEGAGPGVLVVLPDGVLHQLPFAALVGAGGGPLAERFVVSLAPSLDALARLRGRAAAGGSRVLATANTRFDGDVDLRPLRAAAEEARRVAARGRDAVLLVEASEREVKAQPLDSFALIHFATHVRPDERHPDRSSIVMRAAADEDGYLQAREIGRLTLRSPLVVVSGCRSAGGRLVGGEGTLGLAQAFYAAGARSLVLSLWDVEDEATAELMDAFYGELQYAPVGEALRRAQVRLLRSRRWRHPSHWAAFFVSGDAAQRVDLRPRPGMAPLLVGALVALALAGALGAALRARARSERS